MLYLCPICNKTKDGRQNEYELVDNVPVYKHKWKLNKNPCKTCSEVMKDSVVLTCGGCDSITMVNEDVFTSKGHNIRNGDIIEIESCPKCAEDKKFHFLPSK